MKINEIYKDIIELLICNGYDILQIMFEDGTSSYFSCDSFQEPTKNNLESYPYCQLVGINITNFLNLHSVIQNSQDCLFKFTDFINDKPVILLKFSDNIKWLYWGIK